LSAASGLLFGTEPQDFCPQGCGLPPNAAVEFCSPCHRSQRQSCSMSTRVSRRSRSTVPTR
jgi:hypothetical protein